MAELKLILEPDPEGDGFFQHLWELEALHEAHRKWKMYLCEEWNRGHSWELYLEEPDDGYAPAFLACGLCPAQVDDVFPDGQEWLHLETEEVMVTGGEHNSPVALIIPVSVSVWTHHYNTPDGNEWDAGIDLEQIGPSRRETDGSHREPQ